jgi:hypothetical protein
LPSCASCSCFTYGPHSSPSYRCRSAC